MHAELSVGDEVLVDWRGRMGSRALFRHMKRATIARGLNSETKPVQSWAGLTKRRKR